MKFAPRLRGPLAAALTKVYPNQPATRIVRSLAADLLQSSGLKKIGPPFDPFQCARALTIKVQYEEIEAEGVFVDDKKDGPKIMLKPPSRGNSSAWRRINFTLAHEIGHYTIRKSLSGFFPVSQFRDNDPEEEFLCNIFAAELLMPGAMISRDFREVGLDPDSLFELTHKYDVSLKSLLCRATGFGRGRIVSVIWSNREGQYWPSWVSPGAFRQMILCDTRNTSVERAFLSNGPECGRDDLMLKGQRMKWLSVSKRLEEPTKVLTIMRRPGLPYEFLPKRVVPPSVNSQLTRVTTPTQQLLPFRKQR